VIAAPEEPETEVAACLPNLSLGCGDPLASGAQQLVLGRSVLGPDDVLANSTEAFRVSFEDGVEAMRPITPGPEIVSPVQIDPVEASSPSLSPIRSGSPAGSPPPVPADEGTGVLPQADSVPPSSPAPSAPVAAPVAAMPIPDPQEEPRSAIRSPLSTRVYFRRRFKRNLIVADAPADPQSPQPPSPMPLSPAAAFISKLSKTPGGLLPIPHINKRRKNLRPPQSEAPRRSRRVAGLAPQAPEICPVHLKKRVMRALDLNVGDTTQDKEQLSQDLLDEYAKRFSQSSGSHVKALAALFGLTPPEEDSGVESP